MKKLLLLMGLVAGGIFAQTPVRLTDGAGNGVSVTGGKLDVNATATIAADSTIDLNKIGGVAVAVNSGVKGNGTLRIVVATDQPNLTTPLNVQGAAAAGATVAGNPVQIGISDGSLIQYQKMASLANYPATVGGGTSVSSGAAITERGGRAAAVSAPAAGSQATASIAANATARHVFDQVCWSATANGAVTATDLTIQIRDGATGAGNIVAQFNMAALVAAAAGLQSVAPFCTQPLGIVGTTNTAMTAEFSAGLTNLNEAIFFTFYNVQ